MARITGRQCAGARALLGMTQADMQRATGLSSGTITAFENGRPGTARPLARTVEAITAALTSAGIRFIGSTGVDGPTAK